MFSVFKRVSHFGGLKSLKNLRSMTKSEISRNVALKERTSE